MSGRVARAARRFTAGAWLLVALPAAAQLSDPDTTSPDRAVLPTVEPERVARRVTGPQRIALMRYDKAVEGSDIFGPAVPNLVEFLTRAVKLPDIRFVAEERTFSDPDLEKALVLYVSGDRAVLDLSAPQRRRLGAYLRDGGLLFAEDVRALPLGWRSDVAVAGTPFDRQLKALMSDSLLFGARDGQNWNPVPKTHALYSAYFTFGDGPPLTGASRRSAQPRISYVEMLEWRGRVAVLFSELNISSGWAFPDADGRRRALQFGANLVVFAMAQYAATGLAVPSPP